MKNHLKQRLNKFSAAWQWMTLIHNKITVINPYKLVNVKRQDFGGRTGVAKWVDFPGPVQKRYSFKTASVVRAGIVGTSASKELVAKELVSKSLMFWKS